MADHVWVIDHIATYLADGLDTAERLDFENHLQSCPTCAQALAEAREVDTELTDLFADVRPRPGLEDRMIRRLRARPEPKATTFSPRRRFALATAAVLMLGLLGAGLAELIDEADPAQGANGPLRNLFWHERRLGMVAYGFGSGRSDERDRFGIALPPISEAADVAALSGAKTLSGDPLAGSLKTADQLAQQTRELSFASLTPHSEDATATKSQEVSKGLKLPELPPGYRAISVPTNIATAATGYILPGNRVDVLGAQPSSSDARKTTTKMMLQDVLVLGVNSLQDKPEEKGAISAPATVTIGVPAKDAERLAWAANHGAVYLNLRKNGETQLRGASSPLDSPTAEGTSTPSGGMGDAGKPNEPKPPPPPPYFKPNPPAETTPPTSTKLSEVTVSEPEKAPDAKPAPEKKPDESPEPAAPQQKVIRSGEIEFEVEGFDASVERITKIALEEKGFIGTINSDKLPNGKMRGSIVVRVPPDRLDTLILKLRALGDLKGQRVGSQDVTKQYTDVESRLRAARAMEGRLLDIIKGGKGEIKDLLAAEKELGTWRTKIEEMEGEIRYFNNLVSLSTLTITLTEREIRTPFGITENERIEMGIEVEDVDKSQREAHLAVTDAKGRIVKSELKQQSPGQYQAVIDFEVAPAAAGALRDRLRQLGEVTRLDIGRSQNKEGGTGIPLDSVKIKQQDVHFSVSLYNIANVAPREMVVLDLACVDAETTYRDMLTRIQKAAGRVLTNKLDRQRNDQTIGTINFEVKTAAADGVLADLKNAGEVIHLTATENPDVQNSTRSKRGFQVQFLALGRVAARETAMIQLASRDVPVAYQALLEAIAQAKGRVINAQLDEQVKQNVGGFIEFEVRRSEEAGMAAALKTAGDVISRNSIRATDSDNVIDSKVHWQVTLKNLASIAPRETYKLGLEVSDVDHTVAALTTLVTQNKGRVIESRVGNERNGQVTSQLIFDVPLSGAPALIEKFKASGSVFNRDWSRNADVPDGDLAVARLVVVVSNVSPIVGKDQGFFAAMRQGLSWSITALSWSLMFVIVGLLAVLPWAVVIYVGYRLMLRFSKKADAAPVVPTPAG